jgi:hypothetical protein
VPASHRRGVHEKQLSCQRLGSYPLVIAHNARPDEKIPIPTSRVGILQEARVYDKKQIMDPAYSESKILREEY